MFWPNSRLGLCVFEGGRLPRHTRMKSQNQDVSGSVAALSNHVESLILLLHSSGR